MSDFKLSYIREISSKRIGLGCLMPLSTNSPVIYRGGPFYW